MPRPRGRGSDEPAVLVERDGVVTDVQRGEAEVRHQVDVTTDRVLRERHPELSRCVAQRRVGDVGEAGQQQRGGPLGARRRRGEVADEIGRVDVDSGVDAEGDGGRRHPRHHLGSGRV